MSEFKQRSVHSRTNFGHGAVGVRVGKIFYFVSLFLVAPNLFLLYFGMGRSASNSIFPYVIGIVMSAVWISLASEVRRFFSGGRILNPFTSAEGNLNFVGNSKNEIFTRWASLVFLLLLMAIVCALGIVAGSLEWLS
jgi:hypothetical protein